MISVLWQFYVGLLVYLTLLQPLLGQDQDKSDPPLAFNTEHAEKLYDFE